MSAGEVLFVGDEKSGRETADYVSSLLLDGEQILVATKGLRDGSVFTNKRILIVNKQGLTGKKVEVFSISLRSITAFAVENSGTFDLDAELKVYGSGFNLVQLKFTKGFSLKPIADLLAEAIL
uniref:PH domain-containing protein n=1 Tax=Parerythrobacter lutipelagi TaxID=1964208 RepID=UPI0010F760F2|nr:PH domain-containing protein [Parerythrobacter lutipelagi]